MTVDIKTLSAGITYLGVICMLAALSIGMCTYIEAFVMDLGQQFEQLVTVQNTRQKIRSEIRKDERTLLLLRILIGFHSDMCK